MYTPSFAANVHHSGEGGLGRQYQDATFGTRGEMRPHIFGARSLQYSQGASVVNSDTPPTWSPEMALDPIYPYSLREYMREIGRWCAATKVAPARQGPLISFAIGGAGRTIVDQIETDILVNGAVMDFNDGNGSVMKSGVELLFQALLRKFPDNVEATMLRAGLEFFAFPPAQGEPVPIAQVAYTGSRTVILQATNE